MNEKRNKPGKAGGTINFSVRMPTEWQDAIRNAAALAGTSSNEWIGRCAYDRTKMIEVPEGKDMPVPRPVAVARYLRSNPTKVVPLD